MYERHNQPLLKRRKFLLRMCRSLLIGVVLVIIALMIGMLGYHHYEKMSWIDAFANAAMILSGMGPFGPLSTNAGKIFAGIYAIFSGLSFILIVGIIFGPIFHRFFHQFHLGDNVK